MLVFCACLKKIFCSVLFFFLYKFSAFTFLITYVSFIYIINFVNGNAVEIAVVMRNYNTMSTKTNGKWSDSTANAWLHRKISFFFLCLMATSAIKTTIYLCRRLNLTSLAITKLVDLMVIVKLMVASYISSFIYIYILIACSICCFSTLNKLLYALLPYPLDLGCWFQVISSNHKRLCA